MQPCKETGPDVKEGDSTGQRIYKVENRKELYGKEDDMRCAGGGREAP